MNRELFRQAQAAYNQQDYESALVAFDACLQDVASPLAPGEMGLLYHQMGNCLTKLKNYHEAIYTYSQATVDPAYDAKGMVNCNLAMAYAALHDYEDAVRYFEAAVHDTGYDTPYKAYLGMGNALLKLGKSAEAGVAFRLAALDERNPDPTRALLNLGICFMALNRPQDAIVSYESAIPFRMDPATRNKLFANLGQAYVAAGQMQGAVEAFEAALADKTYFLSDSASVDYQRAIAAISTGATGSTGPLAPLDADMSGFDVIADAMPAYAEAMPAYAEAEAYAYGQEPYYYPENYGMQDSYTSGDDRFFNASDEELEKWSRGLAKQQRKHRNIGLKVFLVIIILLFLALGTAVFAYTQGFGYPAQETVVKELFADPQAAAQSLFSSDVSNAQEKVVPVVKDTAITIEGMDKSMGATTVYVTAKTEQGALVQYKVELVRDLIGWKVLDVEMYFSSMTTG